MVAQKSRSVDGFSVNYVVGGFIYVVCVVSAREAKHKDFLLSLVSTVPYQY